MQDQQVEQRMLFSLPPGSEQATINEAALPYGDKPINRLEMVGPRALSTAELLAILIGGPKGLETAYEVLTRMQVRGLARANVGTLAQIHGVGKATAARILAALDIGRRVIQSEQPDRPRITSPADAANLLMAEMQSLEQEHLRVILLNTRNTVISIPTIYIGSMNTSVVRLAEVFKPAIDAGAAAMIVVHNHPSGDPSPSPEDVSVTRHLVQAGETLSIDVLDHVIIGHNRFVSLKERGLGAL